jgi:hypothetical protein
MGLQSLYSSISDPVGYIIDIGASTGVSTDPVYPFITDTTKRGLCIEGCDAKIETLRQNTHFDIHNGFVTPMNIVEIFEKYRVPKTFDILKIDIDGYDLDVIRAILKVYRPKIIVAEFNEKIPPPVLFEVPYRESYEWDNSHCFGFSIASGKQVMDENEYTLVTIYELNNIICVDSRCMVLDVDRDIFEIYRAGYTRDASRFEVLPWNQDVNYWLEIRTVDALVLEILYYFTFENPRSMFEKKTKTRGVDFLLWGCAPIRRVAGEVGGDGGDGGGVMCAL